jgi:hypothetical protein
VRSLTEAFHFLPTLTAAGNTVAAPLCSACQAERAANAGVGAFSQVATERRGYNLRQIPATKSRFLPTVTVPILRERSRVLRRKVDVFGDTLQIRVH